MIIQNLIAPDFSHPKILRFRVTEIQSAHTGTRPHSAAFRKPNTGGGLDAEQFPQRLLFCVVGASGITRRRPDPAITFAYKILAGEVFAFSESPLVASPFVQELSKRLR